MSREERVAVRERDWRTFLVCLGAVVIGLGIVTFAWQFLLLGATLLALSPFHARRLAIWPVLTGVLVLALAVVLIAPTRRCTDVRRSGLRPDGSVTEVTSTRCSSPLASPRALVPPAAAVGAASAVWFILRRRASS